MSTAVAYDTRTEFPGPRTGDTDDERITAVLGDAMARLRPVFDPAPTTRDRARARITAALRGERF